MPKTMLTAAPIPPEAPVTRTACRGKARSVGDAVDPEGECRFRIGVGIMGTRMREGKTAVPVQQTVMDACRLRESYGTVSRMTFRRTSLMQRHSVKKIGCAIALLVACSVGGAYFPPFTAADDLTGISQ